MKRRAYTDLAHFFRESGITQDALAARLGLSQAHISRLKNGLSQPPLDLALRIAAETNIPVESLVKDTEHAQPVFEARHG